MRTLLVAAVCVSSAAAISCAKDFNDLSGQCVLHIEAPSPGVTFGDAQGACQKYGAGYGLLRIQNQYQNNDFSQLGGEGLWDLSWIGASCKANQVADPNNPGTMKAAWVWIADGTLVTDGYSNLDADTSLFDCQPNQCLRMGGVGYQGKWSARPCTNPLSE
jgi:hypothetical protein